MNRRTFLRGIGGVSLALPFLESVKGAKADTTTDVTRRFVVFFQCNGVNMLNFFPTTQYGALTPANFAAAFPNGSTLSALAPYAGRLIVPRGINMNPHGYTGAGCDHEKGMAHKLTCHGITTTPYAGGISVDQEMAKTINPAGVAPLTISVGPKAYDILGVVSYSGADAPVAGQNNPATLLANLGLSTANDPTQAMVAARRKSVLDLVTEDAAALKSKGLSTADQQKLDMHFTALRAAETGVAALSCSQPATLASSAAAVDTNKLGDDSQYMAIGKLQMDIMALGLACGINNVATLLWGQGSRGPVATTFPGVAPGSTQNHHYYSHGGSNQAVGFMDILAAVDTWYMSQYKYLLDKLDAYSEANGATVLDNSAVMFINELSDGDYHDYRDLPIILAGGLGGRLKTGQYLNMPGATASPSYDGHVFSGTTPQGTLKGNMMGVTTAPHNWLLTTLLNAAGATTNGGAYTNFGESDLPPGTYPQLLV